MAIRTFARAILTTLLIALSLNVVVKPNRRCRTQKNLAER